MSVNLTRKDVIVTVVIIIDIVISLSKSFDDF